MFATSSRPPQVELLVQPAVVAAEPAKATAIVPIEHQRRASSVGSGAEGTEAQLALARQMFALFDEARRDVLARRAHADGGSINDPSVSSVTRRVAAALAERAIRA